MASYSKTNLSPSGGPSIFTNLATGAGTTIHTTPSDQDHADLVVFRVNNRNGSALAAVASLDGGTTNFNIVVGAFGGGFDISHEIRVAVDPGASLTLVGQVANLLDAVAYVERSTR